MKKIRDKRIKAIDRQILIHKDGIENEKPLKDTTIDYWKKEIEEKFERIKQEDEEYLRDN